MSERGDQMTELIAQGLTLAQVGEKFGVSRQRVRQIVGSIRNYRPTKREAVNAKKEEIFSMRKEGKTLPEIGKILGISISILISMKDIPPRGPREIPHGGVSGYANGCRCDKCTRAVRFWMRDYVQRKKADGFAGLMHGAESTYALGCKCKLCRKARREADTRRRRARGQVSNAEAGKLRWEARRAKYGPSGRKP